MKKDTVVYSPAKINIHLDIKSRRADGFHDIISIFHKVDLCDEITIRSLKNADNCSIRGDFDCLPEDNLIIRAAAAFIKNAGLQEAYEFGVKKNIPAGAGLGGGSGNAASVLMALNSMNGFPLEHHELYGIGESLGSDVPFFLGGASALATGRGEKLQELVPLSGYEVLLAVPDIRINTRYAYELFDREGRVREDLGLQEVLTAYSDFKSCEWPFFNSFWKPISSHFPELTEAFGLIEDEEPDFLSMSGSGSAVFGLFSDEKRAKKGFERLKHHFTRVWKIKLLA